MIFPRTSSRRTFVAVGLRRQTTTALPWPRSSTRWRRTHSSICCASTPRSISLPRRPLPGAGVHVVNHSAGWYGPDRGDGSGPIGAIVSSARAAGVLWVNSAGNDAQTHWSGTFVSADGDRSHEWAPGDEGNTFVWPNDSEICGVLKWDEWPAGVSDFDLGLSLSETGQRLAISDDYQSGSQPPYEGLCVTQRSGDDLTVYWAILGYDVRSSPRLDLFTFGDYNLPLQYQTAAGSITVPADSPAALAVGALCWQSRQPEYFTSQGPTIDGRTKPDIAGHDSVSGATYGPFSSCPSGFAGTSAAAPGRRCGCPREAGISPTGPISSSSTSRRALSISAHPGWTTSPAPASSGSGGARCRSANCACAREHRAGGQDGQAPVGDRGRRGQRSLVEQVKRNGKVAKTIRSSGAVVAKSPKAVATPWKAPAKPRVRTSTASSRSTRRATRAPRAARRSS